MRRSLAALVPLAVALALVGVALAGGTAGQQTGDSAVQEPSDNETTNVANYENATNYLTMGDDAQVTDFATVGMDVGLEVGVNARELHSTHEVRAFRSRFEAATTDENRSAAYEASLDSIEERADELLARTNGLIASYAQGSIEAETLLRERAAISAEAGQLQEGVSEMGTIGRESLAYDLPDRFGNRIGTVQGRLALLQGPVTDRAARLAAAGASSQDIYLESSSTGYSFALVDGTTYIRETYLGDEYDPTISDQFTADRENPYDWAHEHMQDLYDASNADGSDIFTGVYEYRASFASGDMTAYIHGGTTNVFRDGMQLNASAVPVSSTETAINDTAVLRVNRTFQTGPMAIELFDPVANTTIDGTVQVNGRPIGDTGADGTLWAVEPRGDVTVEATMPEGNQTVAFGATEPTVQGG